MNPLVSRVPLVSLLSPHRAAAERGSFAPAVPILALAILLLGGLIVDAGRLMNARGQALAYAEEAARSGAQAVNINDPARPLITTGDESARSRVNAYCAIVRANGAVTSCELVSITRGPTGKDNVVNTHVALEIDASLLQLVGLRTMTADADARARPLEGMTADDAR